MKKFQPAFLKYFIYNNALTSIMDTLAAGTLLTAYALSLGASPLIIGILGGIPYIGPVANMFGAYLVSNQCDVKKVTVGFAFISRPFYLLCGSLAFFPAMPHAAVWLCVGIGLCYLIGGISVGGYYPWLKAVLPTDQTHLFVERKYFASKAAYIVGFLGAFLLIKQFSPGSGNPLLAVYAFIFFIAFICGMAGTAFLLKIPNVDVGQSNFSWKWRTIREIFTKKIHLLCVCWISLFSFLFFATFVPVFALQVSYLSVATVTALSLLGQVCFFSSLPLWKRCNERSYALRSLKISFTLLVLALITISILLSFCESSLLMGIAIFLILFSAIAQAGIYTGMDAVVLLEAPEDQSPLFFTVVSWVKLGAALGPMTAGIIWMLLHQGNTSWSTLFSWQLFFIICAVGCFVSIYVCSRWKRVQTSLCYNKNMKKIILLITCIFLFFLISIGFYSQYQNKRVHPEVTHAEIYVDPASWPTLLQMVHLIQSGSTNPKFIYWPRSKRLDEANPLLKRAYIERKLVSEGSLEKKKHKPFFGPFRKKLSKFIQRYPNAKFSVHLNAYHNNFIWAVLSLLPPERVEKLYFYEDAFASTLMKKINFDKVSSRELIQLRLQADLVPSQDDDVFFLSVAPLYNTIFYLAYPEDVFNLHPNLSKLKEEADVQQLDIRKIAEKLTETQKKTLLRLVGLDDSVLKVFYQGKPVFLYTLGINWKDPKPLNDLQLQALDDFIDGKFGDFGRLGEDYILLLKEHPWITANQSLKKTVLKKYPQVQFLPKTFPVEILFITGHMPDKVFGYSSSLFFSLPPERILFYIPRSEDSFLPWLKKIGILSSSQIYQVEEKDK